MAFEMVDRDQRLVARHSQRLGADQADHHAANQAWTGGRSNRIAIRKRNAGIGEHAFDHRGQSLRMGASGNFRDHAAEWRMFFVLRRDALRDNRAIAIDQCGCGFVAGTFNAENERHNFTFP